MVAQRKQPVEGVRVARRFGASAAWKCFLRTNDTAHEVVLADEGRHQGFYAAASLEPSVTSSERAAYGKSGQP